MGDVEQRKIRLELLDGIVEVTGSEDFLRRAQSLFIRLVGPEKIDESPPPAPPFGNQSPPPLGGDGGSHDVTDIRSLREQKKPRSAVEMAALVAYYVANAAPEEERSPTIVAADITRLFGHAQYETTTEPRKILFQAKGAGYLDSAGSGQYKLNPVGYNLVTASLPSDSAAPKRKRRTSAKKSSAKKTRKKK